MQGWRRAEGPDANELLHKLVRIRVPAASDLRSQDAKSLGSSASQLGVGGVFAVFGGAHSHAGGESQSRMGKAFACHTGLTSVASQHSARPRGEAP